MAISRKGGRAIWRQVADAVRAEIAAGLAPGDQLPTQAILAERFSVNRHTVRQALAFLESEGVVQMQQGRGCFVAGTPIVYPVSRRTRFTEIVRLQQRMPGGRLIRTRSVPATAAMAGDLDVTAGTPLQVLEILHLVDALPISLAAHHFVPERVGDLEPAYRTHGSITAALADRGIDDYIRQRTRVSARQPSSREVGLLNISRTRPVLITEAINTLPDGTPIELGIGCLAADRVQIVIDAA